MPQNGSSTRRKLASSAFLQGAELSSPAAVFFDEFARKNHDPADPLASVSARPDFVGVIYPGPTPFTKNPETPIPNDVPPSFIACAGTGDRVHALWATDYFSAMLKASGAESGNAHLWARRPSDQSQKQLDSRWQLARTLCRMVSRSWLSRRARRARPKPPPMSPPMPKNQRGGKSQKEKGKSIFHKIILIIYFGVPEQNFVAQISLNFWRTATISWAGLS